jgi:hypothetical protein
LFIQSEIVREKEYKLRQGRLFHIQDWMSLELLIGLIGFLGLLFP